MLPDPQIGEIQTDIEGTLRPVAGSCFGALEVRKGHGPLLPYQHRAFHRGSLPITMIDFSGLRTPKPQGPEPKAAIVMLTASGEQQKPDQKPQLPQLPTKLPQPPAREGLWGSVAKAVLASIGRIDLGTREPLDVYVQVAIVGGLETETVPDDKLVERIESEGFDRSCFVKLKDKNNFLIVGIVKGRLRLKWAEVRADKIARPMTIDPPMKWVRNQDGSIEMDEVRVLAFFPQRAKIRKGHVEHFRAISHSQRDRIYWKIW